MLMRLSYLPGRDQPWAARPLWDYLLFRSASCAPKTILSILSKLAHKSIEFGHVLPLQKHEHPTILHKHVRRMVRELQLRHARSATPKLAGSTPLGGEEISTMLRMFAVSNKISFCRLPHACRHHIAVSAMQHTAGLRFGHFIFRNYTKAALIWTSLGATLLTNWQRYPGKSCAAIVFPFKPRWRCFKYVYNARGNFITAADILRWHVAAMSLQDLLFEPIPGRQADRGDRQRWLRAVCQGCFTISTHASHALMNVTPHSFRGGMAVDMLGEGASLEQIAARGRWLSRKAVKLYAGKCTLSTMCPARALPPFSNTQVASFNHTATHR